MKFIAVTLAMAITLASAAEQTPAILVEQWIAALRSNDLSSPFQQLSQVQQLAIAQVLKRPTAMVAFRGPPSSQANQPAPTRRNRPGGQGGWTERLVRQLNDGDGSISVARMLMGAVTELGVLSAPSATGVSGTATVTQATVQSTAGSDQNPWNAFMPRMMAGAFMSALPQALLADGIESRQIAAMDRLFDAHRIWVAGRPTDQTSQFDAVAEHLVAVGKALHLEADADFASLEIGDLVARFSSALPALKLVFQDMDMDCDKMLASAKVVSETATTDDVILLITFTAYGSEHQFPCKFHRSENGWFLAADSPVLRWLRPAQQMLINGFGGSGGFMRGGRQGQTAAEIPTTPVVNPPTMTPGEVGF